MAEYLKPRNCLTDELALAKDQFPLSGPVTITHEGKDRMSAREYLLQAGCPIDTINILFSEKSDWIFPISDLDINATPEELAHRMLRTTYPIYQAGQFSLGNVNWFGYNDHGPIHQRAVTEYGLALARKLGLSDEQCKRVVIGGVGHDLGNLLNRDIHSVISPLILQRVYPALLAHPEFLRHIRRDIYWHNSGFFDHYLDSKTGQWRFLSVSSQIDKIRVHFGVEAALLIISDKIDIGRSRVNDKALNKRAIDEHPYSEFNLHNRTIGIDINHDYINWTIGFTPYLENNELTRFKNLLVPDSNSPSGYSTYASPNVRREGDYTPDFVKAASQLINKHNSSLLIVGLSGFVIQPTAKEFVLNIVDTTGQSDPIQYQFHKADIVDQVKLLMKK